MNQTVKGLVQGMQRALRDDVLPELTSEHARCQMFGVLDILTQLAHLAVWSPDLLSVQAETLASGIEALEAMGAPAQRAEGEAQNRPSASHAGLEHGVAAAERRLNELVDWCFDASNGLDDEARDIADALLRRSIRDALVIERNLLPRVDFAALTGGRSEPGHGKENEC